MRMLALLALMATTSGCAVLYCGLWGYQNPRLAARTRCPLAMQARSEVQRAVSTPSEPARRSCTSDFACRPGQHCVKAHLQSNGYCARTVDEFGAPTYAPPSADSVGPNMTEGCYFDTQCPPGFRCDTAGVLAGNCVK
jgi:hypothetical protein